MIRRCEVCIEELVPETVHGLGPVNAKASHERMSFVIKEPLIATQGQDIIGLDVKSMVIDVKAIAITDPLGLALAFGLTLKSQHQPDVGASFALDRANMLKIVNAVSAFLDLNELDGAGGG